MAEFKKLTMSLNFHNHRNSLDMEPIIKNKKPKILLSGLDEEERKLISKRRLTNSEFHINIDEDRKSH